jgi:ferrous iron transport protein B
MSIQTPIDEAAGVSDTWKRTHLASDILLVGQPNVGKSVLFSHLTGVRTIASNYPGTTVSYALGKIRTRDGSLVVVDAPGSYSLEPLDEAARVTVDLIDDAARIINVIDSTRLERHLPFTLELLAQKRPMIVALNMCDEARWKGIEIDIERLSEELGVPVVPITARSGEGVSTMISTVLSLPVEPSPQADDSTHPGHHPHIAGSPGKDARYAHAHLDDRALMARVHAVTEKVQKIRENHRSIIERLEMAGVHPVWGAFIAMFVMICSFVVIRVLGEFLIGGGIGVIGEPWVQLPFGTELLFEKTLGPLLMRLSDLLGTGSFLHILLIGSLIDGGIDFVESFGVLTSGIFIPLGAVLPYLFSFYLVLSVLEDSGYLPRLAVFLDNIMHRLGLHGYAIIPVLLGLGCNVPGIMATRILEGKAQRFIVATLISIAVPCTALQAMIIGLVGDRGVWPVVVVYGVLVLVWIAVSIILRFAVKGFRPELLIEIPPYRIPSFRALLSKMWMRISGFFREALPIILVAVLVVNVLYHLNLFDHVARLTEPVLTRLWGMPRDAVVPLLIGVLRKDVALGMFAPLALSTKQLIIGSVLLSMFFPCLATLVVLFRELGMKAALKSIGVMLGSVLIVGSVLNVVLR